MTPKRSTMGAEENYQCDKEIDANAPEHPPDPPEPPDKPVNQETKLPASIKLEREWKVGLSCDEEPISNNAGILVPSEGDEDARNV